MKVLVVYYSRTGNTKKVAIAISNALKCDIEELIDKKSRKGIFGWLSAGRDGSMGNVTQLKEIQKDLSGYDLIIVGGPIWSWNVCSPVRTFLIQSAEQLKNAAFFCTEGGSGGEKAFTTMEQISGKSPVSKLILRTDEIVRDKYQEKVGTFVDQIRKAK